MIDRLRKDDFLYCYWKTGNGTTLWLVRRQDELFLFGIFQALNQRVQHFPYRGIDQIESISKAMVFLGFQEFPVYADYGRITGCLKSGLEDEFQICDANFKAALDEMEKQEAAAAEAHEKEGTGEDTEEAKGIVERVK